MATSYKVAASSGGQAWPSGRRVILPQEARISIAALLNYRDPAYDFYHDQLHRQMFRATGTAGQSALPYVLDPISDINVPAGWWNSNHAQAHKDFASVFPAIYWPSTVPINDLVLSQGPTEWWAFSNRHAHDLANQVLGPTR